MEVVKNLYWTVLGIAWDMGGIGKCLTMKLGYLQFDKDQTLNKIYFRHHMKDVMK